MLVPYRPEKSLIIYEEKTKNSYISPRPLDLGNTIPIGKKDLSIYPANIRRKVLQDYAEPMFDVSKGIYNKNRPKVVTVKELREVKGNGDFDRPDDDYESGNPPKTTYMYSLGLTPTNGNPEDKTKNKSYKNNKNFRGKDSANSNTNLPSLNIVDFGEDEDSDDYTPLYLLCGELFPFLHSDSSTDQNKRSQTDIEFELTVLGYGTVLNQQRISSYSQRFNYTEIKAYLNCVVRGLEIYYLSKSIINYYRDNPLDNSAMRHLAFELDIDFSRRLDQLGEVLKLHYLKPNLVSFIRDMYGNYSTNSASKSPIIKICFGNILLDDVNNNTKLNSDYLRAAILSFDRVAPLVGYFKSLNPSWKVNLEDINAGKKYSPNFLSFWHNSCITYLPDLSKESMAYSNLAANSSSNIYLGIFSNSMQAEYLCSVSYFDASRNVINPGLFRPYSNYNNKNNFIDAKNKISLLVYNKNEDKIEGIRNKSMALSSFIHRTPYYDALLPNATPVLENSFQARVLSGFSLNNIKPYTARVMSSFFRTN